MPRRPRQLAESGAYHVMLRGVNRDVLFLEASDYERFLHALRVSKELSGCAVLAYCLMNNHVHLVLRTTREPVGAVVKRFGVRYAGWFNHKYGRVGPVFQDRFRSKPVETDSYLVTLIRYVWNNPVVAGLVAHPEDYRWSSRRILGTPTSLVDETQLRALLAIEPAHLDLATDEGADAAKPRGGGRRPKFSDDEATLMMRHAGGVDAPEDFALLGRAAQRRVVSVLRTGGVPYAQLARVTGRSVGTIHRIHTERSSSSAQE